MGKAANNIRDGPRAVNGGDVHLVVGSPEQRRVSHESEADGRHGNEGK